MPLEEPVPVKKRRVLSSDYDNMAEQIKADFEKRSSLKERKSHEELWTEVDRQVHMQPMSKIDENRAKDPDYSWQSAMEMGDLATASEILTADTKRLIFPQDRTWMGVHVDIQEDRLRIRNDAANNAPMDQGTVTKLQRRADGELRAFMNQQHIDFGLRERVELSIKESLHHGSFVAIARWDEIQQYSMGGVFDAKAAPVWHPESMWNCYPETGNLGSDMLYQGSMIIKDEKPFDWIMRQTRFINKNKLKNETKDAAKNPPIKIWKYYGDITIQRKTDNIFLPNMEIWVANQNVVILAEPMNYVSVIYGGYDRVDVRDPYHMSPIVKQSPNQKIQTIITNKFLDNIDLKLDPTIIYDGNDPNLIAMGGPKVIPGRQYPSKGGVQNFQQIDVGDPSWAVEAIQYFDAKQQQATGVSAARTGATRQADRITATQIEQEAAGSELRTIDFVNKIEKGITSFLYIQHELNKAKLGQYKFYNPEPGMPDFTTVRKKDLPSDVVFEVIGSKGVLTERRRSQATNEVTAFLLSNPITQDIPDVIAVATQMYADAGNKNPERLMNIPGEDDAVQIALERQAAEFQAQLEQLQQQLVGVSQELVKKEMELVNARDQLQLRNERAEGTENALREQNRILKANQRLQTDYLENVGKIQDEQEKLQDLIDELDMMQEHVKIRQEGFAEGQASAGGEQTESADGPATPGMVMQFQKPKALRIVRDEETGDMIGVVPVESEDTPTVTISGDVIENGTSS